MSGLELPKFNKSTPVTESKTIADYESLRRSELTEKLLLLKEILDARHQADVMSHTFHFYGDTLENTFIPDAVHTLNTAYGPLDAIEVECDYLDGSGGMSFTVYFEFYNEDTGAMTKLKVDRPYNYEPHSKDYDEVFSVNSSEQTQLEGISAVTQRDLNRCLASLVYNNSEVKINALDAFNWSAGDYNKITADFTEVAYDYSSNHEYIFSNSEGGPAGSLSFQKAGDLIVDMQLYRATEQVIDISPHGNLGYHEKAIEVSCNPQDASELVFYEYNQIDDKIISNVLTATPADYQATFDFIDEQIAKSHPLPLE